MLSCLLLSACSSPSGDETPTLPPLEPTPTPGGPSPTPLQPPSPVDIVPSRTLLQQDTGYWTLSPSGGPYDAMSGTLLISEQLDGADSPDCQVEYSLVGSKLSPGCSGCNYTFRVLHTLIAGDPDGCLRLDLPIDGEQRSLGFSSAEGEILFDYFDTGTWLPWYEAGRVGDLITFEWVAVYGLE